MFESTLFRTRLAPTPSGFLHVGNAWSFLLTWLLARSQGGSLHLRIDDLDAARFREEYLEDIFASLEWLGLDWDTGPKNPSEFHLSFSQRHRRPDYRAALGILLDANFSEPPLVYACQCSREQIKRDSHQAGHPGIYSGTCRHLGLPRVPAKIWQSGKGIESPGHETALRIHIPAHPSVQIKDEILGILDLSPDEEMGDFILWQRNGEPSYQLASVVDDMSLGINAIVRGQDLLSSTGAQAYLAERLGYPDFSKYRFYHHGLVRGPSGHKLSKSAGSSLVLSEWSLATLRKQFGGREALIGFFAHCLGLSKDLNHPREILAHFSVAQIPNKDLEWNDIAGTCGNSTR